MIRNSKPGSGFRLLFLFFLHTLLVARGWAQAPLVVNGVADRGNYNSNSVTFIVPSTNGYIYSVKLDGVPVPTDVGVVVSRMDHHELLISRTNAATLAFTNRLIQFILEYPLYNTTEHGYPNWTPYPPVDATAGELAGAQLRILAPRDFALGLEIPVVAWIEKPDGNPVRANALMSAPGHPSIRLFRGAGSGLLAATNPAGPLSYEASIPGLATNHVIQLESSTTWSNVSGILNGASHWPAQSRIAVISHLTIPAGSSLSIDAGAIIKLNSGVNITNNGHVLINGTDDQPVTFTPTSRAQPWGGFFMRTSTGVLDANAAIFVASGAQQTGFPGHKPQQSLFYLDKRPHLNLTNCAAIFLAGQFGHASAIATNASDPNWTVVNIVHTLVQRCLTGGEWNGCDFKLLNSAIVEVPFATEQFADADEDGIYFTTGQYLIKDTVVGWTRDDGVDSGTGEGGSVTLSNTWVESTFHEAFAWSGGGGSTGTRRTTNTHCVALNCGQAFECGFSRGGVSPSPNTSFRDCLAIGNGIGARFGDNYTATNYSYYGMLRVTNSILLHNIRDVYGFNWEDWTYRVNAMDIRGNWLTVPNTNHPANQLWNPAADGWRLAEFMSTPPEAPVGLAFVTWTNRFAMGAIFDGAPVGLSCFTTNFVQVDYAFQDSLGATLSRGTLTFEPGEIIKRIRPTGFDVAGQSSVRLVLSNPVQGELTGQTNLLFTGTVPEPQISFWTATEQLPAYRLGEGMLVHLSTPSAQSVEVDFSFQTDGYVLTNGTLRFSPGQMLAQLMAPTIDTRANDIIRLRLSNPNGGQLVAPDTVYFVPDAPTGPQVYLVTFAGQLTVAWSSPGYVLEQADQITGPWSTASTRSPYRVDPNGGQKFFRLRN